MDLYNWDRVESVFLAAAGLPPEQRADYLSSACSGDDALRAEVESLLALDHVSSEPFSRAVEGEAVLLLDSQPVVGGRLGAYRVVSEIGRGGMGAVYLATRDDQHFEKRVAIKVIKRGMDSEELLDRFRRERQILANLDHPYIARLIDGGSTDDGRPFLAMEFVEGRPIDHFCEARGLTIEDRCRLFLKVCEAVSHAHRNLVVHRDLKPGNILIAEDGTPKLLDFGVAKILDAEGEPGSMETLVSSRRLTPDYASPEQIRGTAISTATDLYSLGAILHELLTGQKPHRLYSTNPGEWEKAICETEIVRPSMVVSDGPARKRLRGDLDNIVMMAMRKDAERRYSSVDHLAEDIERHLSFRPVLARRDSFWYRTSRFVRRQRLVLVAAVAVTISLVAGIVIASGQARRAEASRRIAEERLNQMLELSNRSLSDAYSLLERLPGAVSARKQIVQQTFDFLKTLTKDAEGDPRLRVPLARAYLRFGILQGDSEAANLGNLTAALKSFQAGAAVLGPERDGNPELWLDLQMKTGELLVGIGDRAGAASVLQGAMRLIDRGADPASVSSRRRRSHLNLWLGRSMEDVDWRQALQYSNENLREVSALVKERPADSELRLDLSTAHIQLGRDLLALGDLEETARHYRETIALREELVKDHPDDSVYRRDLALAYEHYAGIQASELRPSLGNPEIARGFYKKARAIEEARLEDPQDFLAKADYAAFLIKASSFAPRPEEVAGSLVGLRTAATMFDAFAESDPLVVSYQQRLAEAHTLLGHRLSGAGKHSEAVVEYERSRQFVAGILAVHPDSKTVLSLQMDNASGMIRAFTRMDDRKSALRHADAMLQNAQNLQVGSDPAFREAALSRGYLELAEAQHHFGNQNEAQAAAREAIRRAAPLASSRPGDQATKIVAEARALLTQIPPLVIDLRP